jgi:hypothetical protein
VSAGQPVRFNLQGTTRQPEHEYYEQPVPPASYARHGRQYNTYPSAPPYFSTSHDQDYGASSATERDRVRQRWADRYSNGQPAGGHRQSQANSRPAFDEARFTGGMSEEEQMQRAMGASMQEQGA